MRFTGPWLAAILVTLAFPSVALAGGQATQSDPADDATFADSDSEPASRSQLLDVHSVNARHDDTGVVAFTFFGRSLDNMTHSSVDFAAAIGPVRGDGSCGGGSAADLDLVASGGGGSFQSASLGGIGGDIAFSDTGATMTFVDPALARRDLRCVSGVRAGRGLSGFRNASVDTVADFCLEGCPARPIPLLEVATPSLSAPSLQRGQELTAVAEIKNTTGQAVSVRRAVITARPPGSTPALGPVKYDFPVDLEDFSMSPGQVRRWSQTLTLPGDAPLGRYSVYATYQDATMRYHDGSFAYLDVGPANPGRTDLDPGGDASVTKGESLGVFQSSAFRLVNEWEVDGALTRVLSLRLRDLPDRTVVRLRCEGRRCPFRRERFQPARTSLDLRHAFRRRALRTGSVVRITLDLPRAGRHEIRFRTRRSRLPVRTDHCQRNGKGRLRVCR